MRRRDFIGLLGGSTLTSFGPSVTEAQTVSSHKLGTLTAIMPMSASSDLMQALAKRGHRLGQNLTHYARGAQGKSGDMPHLMNELKAAGVEVVVTVSYPAAVAAKSAGVATVVTLGTGDPVATGLVDSLARPGGNVTGITDDASMLSTKRLSLLTAAVPKLRRIAMLWNKDDLGMSLRYQASAKAADSVGVTVLPLGVREPDDFNEAFTIMRRDPPDAILMVSDSLTNLNRKRVIEFANEQKLPAIYESEPIVKDGGLMSYGADPKEVFDRAAAMVDQIFHGVRPADIPVEEPTRYLFVVNLKAARAIGVELSPSVIALADEVIE